MQYLHGTPHTRTPVYQGSMDEIKGVLHLKDLMRFASIPDAGSATNLAGMLREVARVPETITIDKLLREFKRRRQQMAIVIDEYGGTAGLVTMGDLLEQVFGDVHDEFDVPEPEMAVRTDGRIYVPGRVLIAEINEKYGIGFNDEETDTMGGLVFHALGRPAVVGDEVTLHGVNLRVEAVERLRITELSISLPRPPESTEAGGKSPVPAGTSKSSPAS
jgi:CBS domain containing-hemolysin-like protein